MTGVAPDAQLVVMKVFGVGGGAYSSDYMAAIEDAIWLNCDSVNLSLGSGSAGRSYGSKSDQQILDSFRNTDTVVTVSAGNNGAWGENVLTGTGMTYTTDVRMHTGGSPGSYTNSFTIASVTNTSMSGVMGKFNGVAAIPGDTGETYGAKNFSTLDTSEDQSGTTYDYVFLGDPVKGEGIYGLPENYANVDVKGKVVLISRGNSSFADKANAAIQAGAAAAVIYNNAPGSINMNLTGYNFPNPAVMIEQSKAKEILAASTQDETTGLWGGKMTVSAKAETLRHDGKSRPEARAYDARRKHLFHAEPQQLRHDERHVHGGSVRSGRRSDHGAVHQGTQAQQAGGPHGPRAGHGAHDEHVRAADRPGHRRDLFPAPAGLRPDAAAGGRDISGLPARR